MSPRVPTCALCRVCFRGNVGRWSMTVVAVLVLTLLGPPAARAELLGLYPFEGDAVDISGNGNDGALSSITFGGGIDGTAAVFAGATTSFINLPIDLNTSVVPQMTWGAWVQPTALAPSNREILSTDDGGFDRVLTIDSRNGTAGGNPLQFSAFRGGPGVMRSSTAVPPAIGNWRFVAGTYDQALGQADLFVDEGGALVKDTNSTAIGASHNFVRVGMHAGGAPEPFAGAIDNVFIFSDVLSDAQLEQIRAGGVSAIQSVENQIAATKLANYQTVVQNEPSLLSYYSFDGDTAAQITDSQPAARHGTSAGTVGFDSATPYGAGQALLLDGTGHVSLDTFDEFNFADGTGTVEAWIRADWTTPKANLSWFGVRDGSVSRYSFHANGADRNSIAHWNQSSAFWAPAPLGNDWHHVVSTVDADGRKFYLDGKLVGSHPQGLIATEIRPAFIGASNGTAGERWIGAIDEVAVYADALTDAQIFAHSLGRQLEQVWDFESGTLDGFQAVPFGNPATDLVFTVPGNQPVEPGFNAAGLATIQGSKIIRTWQNTVSENGDHRTGIAQTDEFVLGHGARFDFLIGGGNHAFTGDPDTPNAGMTALNLERKLGEGDWEMIATASGPPGNFLLEQGWDASDFAGETVRLRIYDTHTSSWGHIDVDYIRYTTAKAVSFGLAVLALFGLAGLARRRR